MATLFHDGELNHCDPLPERDEISRYCSPGRVSHTHCKPDTHGRCEVRLSAFQTSSKEPDLSVNWIQYFVTADRNLALAGTRAEFHAIAYDLRPRGRFVVFNVGEAIHALKSKGYDISIKYSPKKWQPSHSSIYELPREGNREGRRRTAAVLKRLITKADIYNADPNNPGGAG